MKKTRSEMTGFFFILLFIPAHAGIQPNHVHAVRLDPVIRRGDSFFYLIGRACNLGWLFSGSF